MNWISLPRQPLTGLGSWRPSAAFVMLFADFALLGIAIGVQGVLWAALMTAVGAGKGAFGTAQLVSPLISVILLLFAGQLSSVFGKKRLGIASLLLLAASSLALAASADLWSFVGALVVLGAAYGLFESGMNGAALDWEHATGRSGLNVLHAGYSGGAAFGALGAGALLGVGWQRVDVLVLVAVLSVIASVATLAVRYPPADAERPGARGATSSLGLLLRPGFAGLILVGMLGSVGESVANIWSVIFLVERGAGMFLGGATFALVSGAMLLGRLGNARLAGRLGLRGSLWASGVCLILSSALLLIPGGVALAVVAFALLGLGVAGVVPTVLSAASRLAPGQTGAVAGVMLASVYISFMISPPLIGWLAETLSLRAALLTVGASGLGIVLLARGAS